MGQPVLHFEIIGREPATLREFFSALFGWKFDTSGTVSEAVSESTNYGFVPAQSGGIPGGVGGGAAYDPHAVIYVGVPDVEEALQEAERLGATRAMGPARAPNGLIVGHFRDPEGNLIGLASAAGLTP
jgi:uncharacterized protein